MNEKEIRKALFKEIGDMLECDCVLTPKEILLLAQTYEILHGIEQAESLPNDDNMTIGFCD